MPFKRGIVSWYDSEEETGTIEDHYGYEYYLNNLDALVCHESGEGFSNLHAGQEVTFRERGGMVTEVRDPDQDPLLLLDDQGYAIVNTDGACPRNGQPGATAGIGVYFGDEHPMNIAERVAGPDTNQVAEIEAATRALECVKQAGVKQAVIRTDSQFVYNSATNWMDKWRNNGWRRADGEMLVNVEQFQRLDEILDDPYYEHVVWEKISAHSGDPGNDGADHLARYATELERDYEAY